MARTFYLNDLKSIYDLQSRGVELDLERARLWPHSALAAALADRMPFNEIGASTYVLYQSDGQHRPLGLVQSRPRRKRPEGDITFLAPALDADPEAAAIWYRLLGEAVKQLGAQGCQRIYAQLPDESGALEVFRKMGFTVYAREDVYYLPPERMALYEKAPATRLLRRQRKRDAWHLLHLYAVSTPRPVQLAEGMLCGDGSASRLEDWWDQAAGTGYVLESPRDGALVGAARVTRGRAATWLRLYLHPEAGAHAGELVCDALGLVRTARPRPVYCAVREYQSGLRPALESAAFEPGERRNLLVKHTTARVKEPALRLVPNLETSAPVVHARMHARRHTVTHP